MSHTSSGHLIFMLVGLLGACAETVPESRLTLWAIVHDQCMPHQLQSGNPAPCVEVDLSRGVNDGSVVFPDRNGVAQFLLIPTRKISGIESPELREAHAPDYWNKAWSARSYVFAKLHRTLSWDDVGLAVNAATARSQDQLHIHIDCMAPQVRAALRDRAGDIGPQWRIFNVPLAGQFYRARRIPTLDGINLFADVAGRLGIAPDAMGGETLIVTGGGPQPSSGFIVLEDRADPARNDRAHGEDLLDATCALAETAP